MADPVYYTLDMPAAMKLIGDLRQDRLELRRLLREMLANTGGGWISAELVERAERYLDKELCPICDGGEANNCACNCP